ncbi:GntR family transcriptional regulator [Roseobacter sinensis]|uniref:GntR family transcriptional regulator n=1 Tax=Roseobacter sinensis TaxID=2931391 RepID=A0ABT3B8K9_9RHOB|nr:GntR family transcriptional regulator [Roseobacter sp. WL0113]MCV3269910.1 GntR family transcriptional regulator [Roseobacter sp. WL0113]
MQLLRNSAAPAETRPAKRPAHQNVYEELRARILFGDLAPGQAVTIQGLVESLEAGMTPVREAIRRLISDGALSMQGNRRVIVPVLTEDCVEQLDFMRQSLEPELARRATSHIDGDGLSDLKLRDDALNSAIEQGDIRGYLTQNHGFHAALYRIARAPILSATVDRLWLRFAPSLRVVCGRYGTLNLPDKHADLIRALAARDPEAAALAMAEDVHQGMLQIRASLEDAAAEQRFD